MNETDKKKIAEIMARYGAVLGYLFGSAARGAMGPRSDIDVAVIFDVKIPMEEHFNRKLKISNEISNEFKVRDADVIDLQVVSDPLIKYNGVFSGELVLVKDNVIRFSVEKAIVDEYEDTRMLRRIASEALHEQLANNTFGQLTFKSA